MFDPLKYTIGWVCALPVELVAARLHLDEQHDFSEYEPEPNDENTYIFGSIGRHNVVIATLPRGEYGTSRATSVARDLIRSFTNVRIGLMVGIGGGAPLMEQDEKRIKDIRLGDVVVSVPGKGYGGVHQYDYGKNLQDEPFLLTGHLNSPSTSVIDAATVLSTDFDIDEGGNGIDERVATILADRSMKLRKQYARPDATTDRLYKSTFTHKDKDEDCSVICTDGDEVVCRAIRTDEEEKVVIHYGLVASGNTLMKNAVARNRLARKSGVLCFEMEAAGLMNQLPFLVVRGICDYSDTHKSKAWQGYAAMTAAAYAKRLLLRLPSSKVKGESRLSELKEFKECLTDIKSKLDIIQSDLSWQTTRNLRADIMQWLAAPDAEINFQTALELREPTTGSWLLESGAYLQWRSSEIRNVWLHGKAGCGKSVISATIIEDIQRYCREHPDSGYAYFYFTFSDNNKQSWLDCVRSVVLQLSGDPSVAMSLEALHKTCTDGLRGDSQGSSKLAKDLQDILVHGVRPYKQFFLILDALDEIPNTVTNNIKPREQVLDWLLTLSEDLPMLQILTTSRPLVDITERLTAMGVHAESMTSDCVDIDISKWVVSQLDRDPGLRKLNASLKQEAKDAFKQKADGMFRWAYCQMSELRNLSSTQPSDFRHVLSNLPSDLDETYTRMIAKIHPNLQEKALNLLRWLTYSSRPLTLRELSETRIIKLDGDKSYVDTHDRGDSEDVLRILSDLIIMIGQENTVSSRRHGVWTDNDPNSWNHNGYAAIDARNIRLAHFSVQEYLESSRESLGRLPGFRFRPNIEQQYLSHCSVVYLMHYAGSEAITKCSLDLDTFPLLEYVARNWYVHCQETYDVDQEVQFLRSDAYLDAWIMIHDPSSPWKSAFRIALGDDRPCGLYLASFCGLITVAKRLMEAGANINAQGGYYGNALQAALSQGHHSIVKLLLEAGAEVNAQGGYHGNALQTACRQGHDSMVKLLLEAGADISARGRNSGNALQTACQQGHDSVVKLLLEAGADVNAQDEDYGNALQVACMRGHDSVVKLLLEAGANVNARNSRHILALQAACMQGHDSVVKLLLEAGANANNYDLWVACREGHDSIVGLLLEAGADVNQSDNEGRTALHHAAQGGNIVTLRRFLNMQTSDLRVKDKHGKTILDYACISGNKQTVKFVLDLDMNRLFAVDQPVYWSPMHWACRNGSFECLELLNAAGIGFNAIQTKQPPGIWTPLDIASYHSNRKLISDDGELEQSHDWRTLAPSGLTSRPSRKISDGVVMLRKNLFPPVQKAFRGYCDGCLMEIRGDRFRCLKCPNCGYCFMCRLRSNVTHPGHQWEWRKSSTSVERSNDPLDGR